MNDLDMSNETFLGKGLFGSTYKCGDTTIKKYHFTVKSVLGQRYINPCFNREKKLKVLKRRIANIDLTYTIKDLIFEDSHLKAITYDYIEGKPLFDVISEIPFNKKIDICNDLIKVSNELASKFIYPLDYKLDNIIFTGDSIKIIDLDDIKTNIKFYPDISLHYHSLFVLKDMIYDFFNGDHYSLDYDTKKELIAFMEYEWFSKTYKCFPKHIKNFLNLRSKEYNIIFINPTIINDLNITKLKYLIDILNLNVVIIINKNIVKESIDIFNKFNSLGIKIFDIFVCDQEKDNYDKKINQCLNNFNVSSYLIHGYLNQYLDDDNEKNINKVRKLNT